MQLRPRTRVLAAVGVAAAIIGCRAAIDDDSGRDESARLLRQTFADGPRYWAHALPALTRLSAMAEDMRCPAATTGFALVRPYFSADRFGQALAADALPAAFVAVVDETRTAAPGIDSASLFFAAVTRRVHALDELRLAGDDNGVAAIEAELGVAFTQSFDMAGVASLAPTATTSALVDDWIGGPDSDKVRIGLRAATPATTTTLPEDCDYRNPLPWNQVTSPYSTPYNGSCATVAAGACGAKLGIVPQNATCRGYNDLSQLIGATAGKEGAPNSGIVKFMSGYGYCETKAGNGGVGTACQQAANALGRGCDVLMHYVNPTGASGHMEMVNGISVDPANGNRCTANTVSWGSCATTVYDNGSFSNKSDGTDYPAKSFLRGSAAAELLMFCKCK